MIFKPFSILTVPFPFTDAAKSKRRPAVVVSSEKFQAHTGHISLLMITSSMHTHWFGDHKVLTLKNTGLNTECIIRQKIFTIDARLIINEIGYLSEEDTKEIIYHLKEHLFCK